MAPCYAAAAYGPAGFAATATQGQFDLVLYQNDDLGRDYLTGLTDGLGARAKEMIVGAVSYEVTDPTIDSQIITLHASGADVLLEFVSPKPASQAIRKVHEIGWHPTHIVSATGALVSSVLKPAGAEKSAGIITANSGMDPSDPQWSNNSDVMENVGAMLCCIACVARFCSSAIR
jgi:branched-chain amino acid transport system substrate-binding protein